MNQILFFGILALGALAPVFAERKLACPFVKENEQFSNKSQLELEVKCLDNGDYAPLQCFTKNKTCNCVLPDGTQITQPSIRRKYCKCTLEKYNVEMKLNVNGSPIDPPRGTYVPNCTHTGHYFKKQCETGTDVCWCVNKDGTQISKDKKVGITCS